jgi:xanthine dehydrogenase YagR molybdenum-binding subunit
VTSQYEDFFRQETGWSGLLYKSANAMYEHKLARLASHGPWRRAGARRCSHLVPLHSDFDRLNLGSK